MRHSPAQHCALLLAALQAPAFAALPATATAKPSSPTAQAAPAAPKPAAPLAGATATTTATSTPAPSPSPTPGFPVEPPGVPGALKAEFLFLTQAGQSALPKARLSWEAPLAQTYVLKGVAVLRRELGAPEFGLLAPGQPQAATELLDAVELGKAYEYAVQAVDIKGNSSLPSAVAALDLRSLDPAVLAPRAPEGLTATASRHSVKLAWNPAVPWASPASGYRVFRAADQGGAFATLHPGEVTATAYEDVSAPAKTQALYHVVTVDQAGRVSPPSLTVSAAATGTLPPQAPTELTLTARTERAVLQWQLARPGTAPVSAYLLRRIAEPGQGEKDEEVKDFAPLDLSRTSFTDNVDGDHFYRWELKALDAEGNTSLPATLRSWVPGKVFNRTSILLMPTAYTNNQDWDRGWNINVLFDFYVGSLYDTYLNPSTGQQKTGVFQPLQVGTVTGDLKYALVPETWVSPSIAAGFYGAARIGFGSPGGGQSIGLSTGGNDLLTLGDLYLVASKRFGPRSAVHVGAMRGKIAEDLVSLATAAGHPDWELTLRHLSPSSDIPGLLTRFLDPKLGAKIATSPHMLFGGFQFPMTVPTGFGRWKTGLKVEALVPMFPEASTLASPQEIQSLLPLMVNFHIDNLPLFGFEFSIFQFNGGWQWIAFYHIPDLTWSRQ